MGDAEKTNKKSRSRDQGILSSFVECEELEFICTFDISL